MPEPVPVRSDSRVDPDAVPLTLPALPTLPGANGVNEYGMAPNSVPKFARLNTLNALNEGSMLNRSVSLMGQASVVLTSRKMPLPTAPGGGGARYGLYACNSCNCAVVNRPVATSACPAGVRVPASRAIPGVDQVGQLGGRDRAHELPRLSGRLARICREDVLHRTVSRQIAVEYLRRTVDSVG